MSTLKSLLVTVFITIISVTSWFLVPLMLSVGTVALIAIIVFAVAKDYYDSK